MVYHDVPHFFSGLLLEVDPIFRHRNGSVTLDFIQVAYKYWSAYFSTIYQAGFDCVISVQYHIEVSLPFCCLEWRVVWLVKISVCPKLGSTVYCRIILHVYPLLSLFQYSYCLLKSIRLIDFNRQNDDRPSNSWLFQGFPLYPEIFRYRSHHCSKMAPSLGKPPQWGPAPGLRGMICWKIVTYMVIGWLFLLSLENPRENPYRYPMISHDLPPPPPFQSIAQPQRGREACDSRLGPRLRANLRRYGEVFFMWAIKNTPIPSHYTSWLIGFPTMGYHNPQ